MKKITIKFLLDPRTGIAIQHRDRLLTRV